MRSNVSSYFLCLCLILVATTGYTSHGPAPDEEFAVICRTGNRTANLSNWLVTKGGYKNVLNVQEGITSWIKEERPINKSGS